MRPRLPHLQAWLLVLVAGAVLWAHELPLPGAGRLDTHSPFTLLAAMRAPIAVLVLVAGVLLVGRAWVGRRRGRAPSVLAPVALIALAAGAAVQIAPRAVVDDDPLPSGGRGVTILSANVLRSGVRPAVIVDLVRRTRAQAVALPEADARVARSYARALQAATGRPWTAATEARGGPDDDPSARPTSLLTRGDLRAERLPATRGTVDGHGAVRVRLTLRGGGAMVLSAVHPLPPALLASQAAWRENLLALRPRCAAGEVLAGDFNATLDHSPFRSLLDAGCTDAAAARGQGVRATWSGGPFGLVRPAIDHVLTSGRWRTVDAGVLELRGSDHRAVWARVEAG